MKMEKMEMRTSKPYKTMKSILKIKTNSFLDNYKKDIFQNVLEKSEVDVVNNDSDKQVKQWIKEGTLTEKELVDAIKNVMKERIKNG